MWVHTYLHIDFDEGNKHIIFLNKNENNYSKKKTFPFKLDDGPLERNGL